MARKRSRRRRAVRRNPFGRRRARSRARYRRNPGGFRSIIPLATKTAVHAATAVGGKIVARKVRSLLKRTPGTIAGSLVEVGVSLGFVALGAMVPKARGIAEPAAIGALMAPIETLVQQLSIPGVSDSLADDGFLLGADVELVSALPSDEVAGYVDGGRPQGLAGYVDGTRIAM